jgi:hypothetical protein
MRLFLADNVRRPLRRRAGEGRGAMKLTAKRRAMLERIVKHGPILEMQLLASGGRSASWLDDLRNGGLVRRVDHPTVTRRGFGGHYPADAIEATDAGRTALAEKET